MSAIKRDDKVIRDWIIYLIVSPSGRQYVGKTSNFKNRLCHYRNRLAKNQSILSKSLKKYGFDAHRFEILDKFQGNNSKASSKEMFWIRTFMTNYGKYPEMRGMNLTDGGEGTVGRKATPEQNKAQSERLKKNPTKTGKGKWPHTEETKQKIRDFRKRQSEDPNYVHPMTGRGMSEENRKKTSEFFKGKPGWWLGQKHSEESKEKMRKATLSRPVNKGYKWKQESKEKLSASLAKSKGKPILQFDKNGLFIKEFPAIRHASKELRIATSTISNLLNRTKTARGNFIFKYKTGFTQFTFQRRVFQKEDIKQKIA